MNSRLFLLKVMLICGSLATAVTTWYVLDIDTWLTYYRQPVEWIIPIDPTPPPRIPSTKIPPTRISFPSLDKDLVVSAGIIHNGVWDLYDDKVAWLATSEVPGKGNVIMYAHNKKHLFGNLNQLKVGDLIIVEQGDIQVVYKVRTNRQIKPDQVEAILSQQNQLTLYTCDGSFDQKRLVVFADPI